MAAQHDDIGGRGVEAVSGDQCAASVASGDGGGVQPEANTVGEDVGSGGEDFRESDPY